MPLARSVVNMGQAIWVDIKKFYIKNFRESHIHKTVCMSFPKAVTSGNIKWTYLTSVSTISVMISLRSQRLLAQPKHTALLDGSKGTSLKGETTVMETVQARYRKLS